MTNLELVLIIAAFCVANLATYRIARRRGIKLGRDQQWVEDFLQKIKADKTRRNKLGQFKPKNQNTNP
jgi:hypothetical protein